MPNIINDIKLDYKDVLIRPRISTLKSRAEVNLFKEITFRNSKRKYRGIPVMASDMENTGTFEMAKTLSKHGLFTLIHKYYTVEEWKNFAVENPECLSNVGIRSGTSDDDLKRLKKIINFAPALSFISVCGINGYTQNHVDLIKKMRAAFPSHTLIAGDVVSGQMTEQLILAGADIVNVGIGAGSVCTTRLMTGVGNPQLSAVLECADAAHGLNGHIIADGGCTCIGDIAKAFGAGADFVMAGGMFAGHDQGGGELIKRDGKYFSLFYGECSLNAKQKHNGIDTENSIIEGKAVEVPYKGDVKNTVFNILGGLRSTCSYVGASSLQELPQKTTFIRCTQQVNSIFDASPQLN